MTSILWDTFDRLMCRGAYHPSNVSVNTSSRMTEVGAAELEAENTIRRLEVDIDKYNNSLIEEKRAVEWYVSQNNRILAKRHHANVKELEQSIAYTEDQLANLRKSRNTLGRSQTSQLVYKAQKNIMDVTKKSIEEFKPEDLQREIDGHRYVIEDVDENASIMSQSLTSEKLNDDGLSFDDELDEMFKKKEERDVLEFGSALGPPRLPIQPVYMVNPQEWNHQVPPYVNQARYPAPSQYSQYTPQTQVYQVSSDRHKNYKTRKQQQEESQMEYLSATMT